MKPGSYWQHDRKEPKTTSCNNVYKCITFPYEISSQVFLKNKIQLYSIRQPAKTKLGKIMFLKGMGKNTSGKQKTGTVILIRQI